MPKESYLKSALKKHPNLQKFFFKGKKFPKNENGNNVSNNKNSSNLAITNINNTNK